MILFYKKRFIFFILLLLFVFFDFPLSAKTKDIRFSWQKIKTDNFIFYYPYRLQLISNETLQLIKKNYNAIADLFHFEINESVNLILFPPGYNIKKNNFKLNSKIKGRKIFFLYDSDINKFEVQIKKIFVNLFFNSFFRYDQGKIKYNFFRGAEESFFASLKIYLLKNNKFFYVKENKNFYKNLKFSGNNQNQYLFLIDYLINKRENIFWIFLRNLRDGKDIWKILKIKKIDDLKILNIKIKNYLQDKIIAKKQSFNPSKTISFYKNRIYYIKKKKSYLIIRCYDKDKKSYLKDIFMPFANILELKVSPDGKSLLFTAICHFNPEIYIYNLISKKIIRITYNLYIKKDCRWLNKNEIIYFSNENKKSKFLNKKFKPKKYNLISKDKK